jgi:tight adherence protein C
VSGWVAFAVPLGITLGLGLWTLLAIVPRVSAPQLSRRLAPYLTDVSPAARELVDRRTSEPGSLLAGVLGPLATSAARAVTAVLGGDEAVTRRLRQSGSRMSVQRFRSNQLIWCAAGLAVGAVAAVAWSRSAALPVPALLVVVLIAGAIGMLAPEQLLARRARARQTRIAAELPTVLEFLTLALSAGEGVHDAVRRVARTGNGELARELGVVVADVNAGVPLGDALTRCATQIGLPSLTRAIDQLVGALERGTPLAEVLRAQADDVRDESKRALLESAGQKEVTMLIPLVFLILPVTVAFALWPASLVLQIGF